MSELAFKNAPTPLKLLKLITFYEVSNIKSIFVNTSYAILFYLSVLIVFSISLKDQVMSSNTAIGLHFSAMSLAVLLSAKRFFKKEIETGFIDQLKLTGVSEICIYSAKSIICSLISSLFYLMVFPLSVLLLNINQDIFAFIVSSVIFFISASFIICLISLLGCSNEKIDYLLPLLTMPFLIPLIIISILGISTFNFFMLNIFLMMFFGFFCSYLGSKII